MSSLEERKMIREKHGQTIKHSSFGKDLSGECFTHYIFQNVGATGIKSTKCNFSYTRWNDAYLRNCTFSGCDFTGARFSYSIIKDCDIKECAFKYAQFFSTQLSVREIIKNLPFQTNLRWSLCRNLRSNAESLNDKDGASKALEKEIYSSKKHYKNILCGVDKYYQNKYRGICVKVSAFWTILKFFLLEKIWGYGEKPQYILRSIIFVLLFSALFISCTDALSFWASLKISTEVFLGLETVARDSIFSFYVYVFLIFFRYISLGLFVSSVIYKTRWR